MGCPPVDPSMELAILLYVGSYPPTLCLGGCGLFSGQPAGGEGREGECSPLLPSKPLCMPWMHPGALRSACLPCVPRYLRAEANWCSLACSPLCSGLRTPFRGGTMQDLAKRVLEISKCALAVLVAAGWGCLVLPYSSSSAVAFGLGRPARLCSLRHGAWLQHAQRPGLGQLLVLC